MLSEIIFTKEQVRHLPLRILAHLGDSVFDLFEREKAVFSSFSAKQMHKAVVSRVIASKQSHLLNCLLAHLSTEELEIVRRGRNLKPTGNPKSGQSAYRKATAFECLLGYLYLTDQGRLRQILSLTASAAGSDSQR